MIPLISFDREKTLRKYCVSVYILISPKRKKVEKIRYNKSTYKIITIQVDGLSVFEKMTETGYDCKLDKVYILMESGIEKYLRKKPSLLKNAIIVYSPEDLTDRIKRDLI